MRLPANRLGLKIDRRVTFSKNLGILALRLSIIACTACYAFANVFLPRRSSRIREMSVQDSRIQQMLKIRRTTLGFGVVQILLGISLTALSFTAFAFTSSDRIRNACPYWAGFTVFCSGCLGIIAWKHSSVMSMSLFTFFSAVCVVLQMIGTILTGDAGGLLKSLIMCEKQISGQICKCCDSIAACRHDAGGFEFEGVNDCSILSGLLTGLMYGLCVLTIFGSLLCFVATILGCTAVARETNRNQGLCSRHSSRRSHTSNLDRCTWSSYPTDLSMLPSYAPPVYHSVENFQDYGLSSCIVPPPVFDPTDLPPPYSSQNHSLAESQYSLSSPETSTSQVQQCPAGQDFTGVDTSLQSAINQVHCPAGWELTQVNTSVRSAIHDESCTVQSDQAGTTCSSPSGVIHIDGGDPSWDEQFSSVSLGSELFLPSGTSCLSSDCTDESSPDRELCRAESIDLNSHETVNSKSEIVVVPFKAQHPSFSVTRLQAEFCELVPGVAVSKKRSSSFLGSTQNAASNAQVNIHPVATVSSPLRGATVLSLRTRCSSLGENSIYVNSFEVLARPPPNVRIPDEPGKPFTTNAYFNTRNAEQRLPSGVTHNGDTLIEPHGNGRSEQRKERSRHRRRRHPLNVPKHKEKRNASCELPTSEVNSAHAHGDLVSPGKETIV